MNEQKIVCNELNLKNEKERIIWLDIAKGLAVLCTIVGHVLIPGANVRNLIYSFHIPLFFVLSGYTIKRIPSSDFGKAIWKDFKRLLLPVLVMGLISCLINIIMYDKGITYSLWDNLRRILWGNGNNYILNYISQGKQMYGIGVLWFFIALFWAKLCYRYILNKISNYRFIFLLGGAFVSIWLGTIVWLPQSIDMIFIIILFMESGYQLKNCGKEDSNIIKIIGIIGFFIWITLSWNYGIHIELSIRHYPYCLICILIAFLGCLSVIQLSKAIAELRISKAVAFIGRHSMTLLCIHYLDKHFSYIWKLSLFDTNQTTILSIRAIWSINRVIFNVLVLLVWTVLKKQLIRLKR